MQWHAEEALLTRAGDYLHEMERRRAAFPEGADPRIDGAGAVPLCNCYVLP